MKALLFILMALLIASSATANTWYVEKNGSGDFTIIQDAVDAAASGDTIRIGPGEYTDTHFLPEPYEVDIAAIHVSQQELTIIGAGSYETVIGPDYLWEPWQ